MNPLDKALARMVVELEEAFAAPLKLGEERLPYIDALVAVSRFAKSAGIAPAWRRLHEFAERLQDLDRGRVDPLLAPNSTVRGVAPDSGVTWNKRILVLVAFQALRKSEMNQQEAARYIAKRFPAVKFIVSRGTNIPATILRWKRDLEDARPKEFLYRFGVELAEHEEFLKTHTLTPKRWKEWADSILDRLLN